MINIKKVKQYCKDDISRIENYELAINDKEQMWDCHHRLELTLNGEFAHTSEELKQLEMYYKRPYFELIFLTKSDHKKLHSNTSKWKEKTSKAWKGKKHSEETRKKMSKGREGKTYSEFGRKFKEHFGITRTDNIELYKIEHKWYRLHNNKCRWEK